MHIIVLLQVNIQNGFQQLYKILDEHYTEEDQQIVAAPSIEQVKTETNTICYVYQVAFITKVTYLTMKQFSK